MKTEVHKVKGEKYCAIDDIAAVVSSKGEHKTGLSLVIELYKKMSVYYIPIEDETYVKDPKEPKKLEEKEAYRLSALPKKVIEIDLDAFMMKLIKLVIFSLIISFFIVLFLPLNEKHINSVFSIIFFFIAAPWAFLKYDKEKSNNPPRKILIYKLDNKSVCNNKGKLMNLSKEDASNFFVKYADALAYLAQFGKTESDFINSSENDGKKRRFEGEMTARERENSHRILYAMKEKLLDQNTKNDKGEQLFKKQTALIKYLSEVYQGYGGFSESNLKDLYAELNKAFDDSEKTFTNS